jgi:hypothetical protein
MWMSARISSGFPRHRKSWYHGHPRDVHHHCPDEFHVAGEVHRVGENPGGVVENPDPHPRDEEADGKGDDRVGLREPEPDGEEAAEDSQRDEDVASRVLGVGDQDLAPVFFSLPAFVGETAR